jgi:hypothetical protein
VLKREIVQDHAASELRSRLVMDISIRNGILARNQELRRNPHALVKNPMGTWILSIPILDYEHFKRRFPDLFSGPAEDRKIALARFMASPESEPYKVRG